MVRRGSLQRGLIILLTLLMVTPQMLLRPCCCAQDKEAKASAPADISALPPCCQKRLQAAQNTAAAQTSAKHLNSNVPGVHDSSRCACRIHLAAARTGRVQFKTEVLRHLDAQIAFQVADLDIAAALDRVLRTDAQSASPDWGAPSYLRLCRWVV